MKTNPTEERAEFISFTWGQTDKSRQEKTSLKSTIGIETGIERAIGV